MVEALLEVKGSMGTLFIYSDKVLIKRLSTSRQSDIEILLKDVISLEFKNAVMTNNGFLHFTYVGSKPFDGNGFGWVSDENTIGYNAFQQKTFVKAKIKIDELLKQQRTIYGAPKSQSPLADEKPQNLTTSGTNIPLVDSKTEDKTVSKNKTPVEDIKTQDEKVVKTIVSLDAIKTQVTKVSGTSVHLDLREIEMLPDFLWEGESIEKIVQGTYNLGIGVLVATNKRLFFMHKGLLKLQVEDFPYEKISSIYYSVGMIFGTIIVYTAGNKAEIENLEKISAKEFAEFVRAYIANNVAQRQVSATNYSGVQLKLEDIPTQIKKLAELKKQGIISTVEFEKKKVELLARM